MALAIFAHGISTIGTLIYNIYELVKNIYTQDHPDVNARIKSMDIERRLKLAEAIIASRASRIPVHEDPNKYVKLGNSLFEVVVQENQLRDPIEISLLSLIEIVQEIYHDLATIRIRLEAHRKKWFYRWRTLDVQKLLSSLEIDSKILDARFHDLLAVLQCTH